MNSTETGSKYDQIAQWWHDRHNDSSYGVPQLERAVSYSIAGGKALDVGCGTGGRFIRLLENSHYSVTGIDVSEKMIELAARNHPAHRFLHEDICIWEPNEKFDLVIAWDSIFHLPLAMQKPVLSKLCESLTSGGVLMYSFGNASGEHTDQWHNEDFYYSSIGINGNAQLLMDNGLTILHLELDQYPEKHMYAIASRL